MINVPCFPLYQGGELKRGYDLKNLPYPLFAKEGGIIPPFGKGRLGGILQTNVVFIFKLLIT